ncbi:MAG TPA: D-alanyl-D-alanine carboxypeptidase/D-alanyl-D-alanine-endopeptidase [bacterium]|nr:D-alanyl-D-alanine carboxypeptidase/D-alanyl-D-alanine-endopeptidase [bacterium]HPS28907.1 D-alanyl-D-alanine carboxypeptidase/D-alanyl-D-alanine-endopeptidase [bacterium]
MLKKLLLLSLFILFTSILTSEDLNSKNLNSTDLDITPVPEENLSIVVYDIDAKKEVVSINPDKPLSFASNVKLLTTASVLQNLGGGFRFMTMFSFDPEDGILYIKAAGDPEMVMENMWLLATDLKRRGISNVQKVVVDDFIYGNQGRYISDSGEKGDNAYLAYISPLGLNYNSVEMYVKPTVTGGPVDITISTPGPHFIVENTATTVKGGYNRLLITAIPKDGKTLITVKGTLGELIKKPFAVYKKIYDPTNHYVETLLFMMNEKDGIPISRQKLKESIFTRATAVNHILKSSPMRDILRTMNRYSSNFIADSLVFFMGAILKGDVHKGIDLLKEYAKQELGETVDVINGSGLGNDKNLLTGRFFVKLLKKIYSDPYLSLDYFSTLPVMGEDGTLKRASSGNDCTGFIRGKTGSLTGVTSLSGLMKAKSGKLYLYAFTVNSFQGKKFKDSWGFRDKIMQQLWEKY